DRDQDDGEDRLADHAPEHERLERGSDGGHADRREQRAYPEREAPGLLGLVDEEGAEDDETALREVDHAGGAEDHDETERDERVHGTERQAVGEQGEELCHDAYIRSMRSWNCAVAIPRRTFCVAVSAPVSSRSMGSSSNPRT